MKFLWQLTYWQLTQQICRLAVLILFFIISACDQHEENVTDNKSVKPAALIRAIPGQNSLLTESPASIRLFFNFAPVIEQSTITLSGSGGEIDLVGMHTMGMDDIMVMVNRASLEPGEYSVSWRSQPFTEAEVLSGYYSFTIVED